MAYIEVHQELIDHPKIKRMSRMLGIHPMQAVGHVLGLWCWALDYALDGDVSRFDAMDLAEAARWDDDPERLVKALVECGPGGAAGLLDPDWRLHDWRMYTAGLAAARQAGALGNHNRWHRDRGVHVPECPHCVAPESQPESGGDIGGESEPESPDVGDPNPPNRTQPHHPTTPDADRRKRDEDDDTGFDDFWEIYPERDGKKLGRGNALIEWRKLNLQQRRRAFIGARNLGTSDQIPKDAERFLRRAKGGKGDYPFEDWQTPASPRASPRDKPVTRDADGNEFPL